MNSMDFGDPLAFPGAPPGGYIGWIAVEFGAYMCGVIDLEKFGDPRPFLFCKQQVNLSLHSIFTTLTRRNK